MTKKALGTYLDDGDETKSGQVFYKLGESARSLIASNHPDIHLAANLDDRIKNADQCVLEEHFCHKGLKVSLSG